MPSLLKKLFPLLFLLYQTSCAQTNQLAPFPTITGNPKVYQPDLLNWKTDFPAQTPDLSEPTSNRIFDLHLQIKDCEAFDLILSTSGNYHMALTEFWRAYFLPKHAIQNWFFSTSPPISPEQSRNQALSFGNVALLCTPHLAVGPKSVMEQLQKDGMTEGKPLPLFTNRGNVLLVKKGNPKNIQSIWDLARSDVRLATSNPFSEPGSFGNYAQSIYNIALQEKGKAAADELFETIFGTHTTKWVVGKRIHHREVPHLIYKDQADVSMVFYHLARFFVEEFPDEFEIIPLGGTVAKPQPLKGNKVGKLFITRIKTPLTATQHAAREALMQELKAGALHPYLRKHYIDPVE